MDKEDFAIANRIAKEEALRKLEKLFKRDDCAFGGAKHEIEHLDGIEYHEIKIKVQTTYENIKHEYVN
jgi:hypothetical protein